MRNLRLEAYKSALLTFLTSIMLVVAAAAGDSKSPINKDADDVAIKGYDVVAYFTDAKPTKGNPEFSHEWQDAKWHFATAEHLKLFKANPEKYAPQFGGHCAMALTNNVVLEVDPNAWTITEGKLYLNFSMKGRDLLREDLQGNIAKSEKNWAKIQKK